MERLLNFRFSWVIPPPFRLPPPPATTPPPPRPPPGASIAYRDARAFSLKTTAMHDTITPRPQNVRFLPSLRGSYADA